MKDTKYLYQDWVFWRLSDEELEKITETLRMSDVTKRSKSFTIMIYKLHNAVLLDGWDDNVIYSYHISEIPEPTIEDVGTFVQEFKLEDLEWRQMFKETIDLIYKSHTRQNVSVFWYNIYNLMKSNGYFEGLY